MKTIWLALALMMFAPFLEKNDDELPLGDFGTTFLKSRFKVEAVADMPLDKLRADHCVRGTFGTFEIAYPIWQLDDKHHIEDLRSIAVTLVQLQVHWMDWLAKGDERLNAPKADAETLIAWIKSWKAPNFARAESAPDKDLFVFLGATDAQKAASKNLGAFIGKPDVLGAAPRDGKITRILFAPKRLDFVQMLGYAGLLDPTQQAVLWTKTTTTWTNFWIDWTQILALEYPPWSEDKEFKQGLSMNKFEPTGMLQHTVQQAMLTFLWMVYGDSDAIHLNQAQALAMAVELCGEVNALEGDGGRGTTGAKTNAYEKFVPGGNSAGGILPPISALPGDGMKVNPWHENLGRDYFTLPLRKGQKLGAKGVTKDGPPGLDPIVVKDKAAHFSITSLDGNKRYVVSAPFMGVNAKIRTYPPPEFVTDFREFFRAYKCGFLHWLQTMGDKSGPAESEVKYQKLMKALANRDGTKALDAQVAEIYALPLSGKSGETDSLEWRFLDWIAKGK
ncbi:MAG: hypothetical protein SGI72_11185 [Planctomycetota bacterium]|nr:hypothetical protein [Planctomycetota bacterium]